MNTITTFTNKNALLFFYILIVLITCSHAQTKSEKIDQLVKRYVNCEQFNGAILVAEKGEIIYKKAFGFANFEWDIPNQVNTKFRLASVSKQFTAMLILQLVAENKLKLDVPISTYLPDYPKKNAAVITLHHLLTHTSGTPNYTSFPNYKDEVFKPHSSADLVHLFADSTLEFKPGEKFNYSNSGYVLLGYIIEKVTGKSYEQVLQEKIFTPLKMINSGYDHTGSILKNRADAYENTGINIIHASFIDMSVPLSAGGIYSTVEDLYLWDQALYTEKLLPKKYMDLIFTGYVPSGPYKYGYGWDIGKIPIGGTKEEVDIVQHNGGINGFNTLITRIPGEKSSVILLNNTGHAPLLHMVIAINGILHNKPYDFPKKSIARSLTNAMEKDGLSKALIYYQSIKDSTTYYKDENEMNGAGYYLWQANKIKEAEAVLKLNTELFPNAFNTFDSYAEILLAVGKEKDAIENYKKSVKLNPKNENGIKVLKEHGVNTNDLITK